MKFLVDVNASGAVVILLEELGHDVAQVVAAEARERNWWNDCCNPDKRIASKMSESLTVYVLDTSA